MPIGIDLSGQQRDQSLLTPEEYRRIGKQQLDIFQNLLGDTSIDDMTKDDIFGIYAKYGVTPGDQSNAISKLAYMQADARGGYSGDRRAVDQLLENSRKATAPMFASRQYLSQKLRMMKEAPGRAQTLLAGGNSPGGPVLTGKTPVNNALDIALGKAP